MSQMPPVQPGYQGPMPGADKPAGMAVASMVLGIVSFLFCWIPWIGFISWITAILAVIFGIVARGKVRRGEGGGGGMAMAGMVLGIVYLSIAIIGVILLILGFSMFGNAINKELERQQKLQQQKQQGTSMLPMVYEHVAALWNILGYVVGR